MPSDRTDQDDNERSGGGPSRKGGNPLQRGSACLSCRKRKMKCDATKPVCRQCVKANRADECDYDDGRQKSRTQILQEKIAKLEERIRELEGLDGDGGGSGFGDESIEGLTRELAQEMEMEMSMEEGGGAVGSGYDVGFGQNHSFDEYGNANNGYAGIQHNASPSGSGSGSSHNGHGTHDAFSPLLLGASASSTSLSFPSTSVPGQSTMLPPNPHASFYPTPSPNGAGDIFGFAGGSATHTQSWPTSYPSASGSSHSQAQTGYGMEDLGLDLGMNINMGDVNLAGGMGVGGVGGMDPSIAMAMGMDFSAFTSPNTSSGFQGASTVPSSFSNAGMGFPSSSSNIHGVGHLQGHGLSHPQPQSLSIPAQSSISRSSTRSTSASASSSSKNRPKSRWEADTLALPERKILTDIFLPHARQCGLDLSPERLYQRLELDAAYPNLFPSSASSTAVKATPAHPALAHAIYLLACHFSSVTSPTEAGKMQDLSTYEPHFLTRALRGIAAALEAGEAATADSPASSRSSRSSRSRSGRSSRGGSGSARSSYSPSSASASPSSSIFQVSVPAPGSGAKTTTGAGDEEEKDVATPLVDAVQASALLAVYFFAKARLLEGYYHASAAARLAVSLGMHQVRSAVWRPPSLPLAPFTMSTTPEMDTFGTTYTTTAFPFSSPSSSSTVTTGGNGSGSGWSGSPSSSPTPAVLLPPPRSALEHAERVATFWSVFFVDRCWSVATGLPSSLPDDEHPQLKISSVWPWDGEVEVTRESADYETLGTLFDVNATMATPKRNMSPKALKAKAAAFFERAARIASMQSEQDHWDQFRQLEYTLAAFIASLPSYISSASTSLPPSPFPSPHLSAYAAAAPRSPHTSHQKVDVELALVHTLAHAATIQLHHPQAQKDAGAHAACVRAAAAACSVLRALGPSEFRLLDPVVGTCWMCVSDVLLRERTWGGDMHAAREAGLECSGVEAELDVVVGALRQLSVVFPVALYQVQKVEQSRNLPF